MMMEDDWATSGALEKDVFISSVHNTKDTIDILKLFDNDIDGFSDDNFRIKTEPNDETSDYHGSSSGSPSSSLSSPNAFKDEPLGLDVHFGSSLFNAPFSPSATSSHSPTYGMMNNHSMAQQHSPLPSVTHFSHNHHLHHHVVQHHQPNLQVSMNQVFHNPSQQYITNNVPHSFLFKDATIYEGMGGMGLAAAQQQLKARNKMHEMALRQHLITDQVRSEHNLSANGDLVLSPEERRTLLQEGYPIPQKYPLSKSEEESLKIVRRKIKNKLSAQESRRKRKEYIDALESRLHCFSEENKSLKQQVHQLEASNRDLQQKLHQYESKEKM
uniref:BZIP domain-containing protein n=1 Tax=Caenorhabditis tropicalis TaxID=1561998 RepID=A0A1I7U8K9_9PELO